MKFAIYTIILACAHFAGLIFCLHLGRNAGLRHLKGDPKDGMKGLSAVEGAVFGLLGLLFAFTFSSAAARFDERRHLIIDESNAIGTAYLRIDLLPVDKRPALREHFRRYLDARLAAYAKMPDVAAAQEALRAVAPIQQELWTYAVTAARETQFPPTTQLLIPALNEMFDIAASRAAMTQMHPPKLIFAMLFGLSLLGALVAGYGMAAGRKPSRLHLAAFAGALAICVYVILDLEYPRMGFLRVDEFDQILMHLRASMQ